MVENSNGNGRGVECTECHPPRQFKNKAGLNGHIQFKQGRLPDSRDVLPNGKQSQMYQDLTDRVNQVIARQDDIFDHFTNQSNGNGNEEWDGLPNSEGSDYSSELIGTSAPPPVDPTTYSHQDCGAPLARMQRHCGACAKRSAGMAFPRNRHWRP